MMIQVHVGFVYIYRHIILFIGTERTILTGYLVYSQTYEHFFFQRNSQNIIFLEWSIHSSNFLINEQVPSNFCTLHDSKMDEVYSL